jgi:hypothetical protein
VPRRVSFLSLSLFALLLGCGGAEPAPSSAVVLSQHGLVEAVVHFEGPIERGYNTLFVELRPQRGEVAPSLIAVDAVMPAHTHHAHAASIQEIEHGFRASELDLYMTGRWQLELQLELGTEQDTVSMPVDVP